MEREIFEIEEIDKLKMDEAEEVSLNGFQLNKSEQQILDDIYPLLDNGLPG